MLDGKGWKLPDEIEVTDTLCLKMDVPAQLEYVIAVVGAIYLTGKWWKWEKGGAGDRRATNAAQEFRDKILPTLEIGECEDGSSNSIDQSIIAALAKMEVEMIDMKYRINGKLYEPVMDLVECGCGDIGESVPSDVSGADVPNGRPPANYGGLLTVLDVCTNINILKTAYDQALDDVGTGAYVARLIEFVPFINELIDEVQSSILFVEEALDDPDFLQELRRAVIRGLPDPVGDITREKLRGITRYIPVVYDGAPMRDAFRIAVELLNIAQLNVQYGAVVGTGVLGGDCSAAFNSVGVEPYRNPTPGDNDIVVLEDTVNNLKYTRVLSNGTIGTSASASYALSGEEFYGYMAKMLVINPVTGGAIFNNRTNNDIDITLNGVEQTIGANLSGDGGTSGAEIERAWLFGAADLAITADNFDSATFGAWGAGTSGPAFGETYPVPGAFSGQINFSNQGGVRNEDIEIWIVTDISGSAQIT